MEVSVHHVERHLDAVEQELVLICHFEHVAVNLRTLVSRKSNVPDFARLLRFHSRLHATARGEDPLWIVHANDFVKLQQVDAVGLKATK